MAISVTGLDPHTQVGSGTWQDYGSGGGSGINTTLFVSSTSSRARKFTGVKGFAFEINASGESLANSIVVVRFLLNGGFGSTLAAGGGSIRLEDTSGNQSDFYVIGSDTDVGGWQVVVIDTSQTESANNGSPATMTAIQYVGMVVDAAAASGGDPNFYIDEVLSLPNTGLTLAGNTTQLFDEAAVWDDTSKYGVIETRSGVVFSKCKLTLSPDASDHVSTDETLVFEELVYDDNGGGSDVNSAVTELGLLSADADTITLTRLNARCDENADINGTYANKTLDFASATDIVADTCFFTGFDGDTCALGGSGNSYDGCTLLRCAEITDTGAVVRDGFVRDSACASTEAALLWTASSDWERVQFYMGATDSYALRITTNITDTLTDLEFYNYSTSAGPTSVGDEVLRSDADGGTVTLSGVGITGTFSYHEAGTSTVDYSQSVSITITVQDVDGNPIEGAKVFLEETGGADIIPFDVTNASGIVTASYTGSTPQDVVGYAAKGQFVPTFKRANINDTIGGSGLAATISMVSDD